MPRLFFALGLPDSISDELDGACEGIPQARWALDNAFHITLVFLGNVPAHLLADVVDVARSIRLPPFELQLEGAGVFPNRGQPRVLWIGVQKQERLLALQRTLQTELRHVGFEPEKRKFRPHVTLARLGNGGPREAVPDWLARHLGYRSAPFKVQRFYLMSSTLRREGSVYQVEQSFLLRGL